MGMHEIFVRTGLYTNNCMQKNDLWYIHISTRKVFTNCKNMRGTIYPQGRYLPTVKT
jgi:hypothetical protein